ncbi:DHHA1 domain-containing protein [Natrinema sp. 1APR25-10V2]|uniref:alanine--tRNA ligase-related protein n=1 Tax=Natrinema sp. 1APR25-10V2 TaxID=2951081 RepID=UPI002873FDB2|nr:DHHA1 domain-containing protein [Natrinema sp. 1APR25-10V2]MDS0476179.1 DHHA1 domain-containing protein [Natrinema sp. 1APR25-10V2]
MTSSRAPELPELRAFETTVEAADGRELELAETYFYPEGGGQPADRGTIDGIALADVQEQGGAVVHTLESEPDVAAGDSVACVVDDAHRMYCMRAHTASHVVYGSARRLFDELGYAGFDIGEEKIRLDLTTADPINEDDLIELGRLSNLAVWNAQPVTWERLPADEARGIDGIAFNEQTEDGAMATDESDTSDGHVRVVTIGRPTTDAGVATDSNEPWDVAACGGTHVPNTRQIGPIEVLGRSNPGEGVTRVEFAVGPAGIDHAASVRAATREASQVADVPTAELPEAVARLQDERAALEDELARRERDVLDARLTELPTVERDSATWAVGTIAGFDPNVVSDGTRALVDEGAERPDVVAVVDTDGTPSVVVASTGTVDAGNVIADVTDTFGGGGGGGSTVAQGGGLTADPDDVVAHLRGE